MTTNSGSSGGGGGGGGGGGYTSPARRVRTDQGNFITLPTAASEAPRGASLGQRVDTGGSLVATGGGRAVDTATGSLISTNTGTTIMQPNSPGRSLVQDNQPGRSLTTLPTQVNQPTRPAEPVRPSPSPGGGPVTSRVRIGPERNPALSSNFLSIIGGAGGLGRRGSASKRTLIGGA